MPLGAWGCSSALVYLCQVLVSIPHIKQINKPQSMAQGQAQLGEIMVVYPWLQP